MSYACVDLAGFESVLQLWSPRRRVDSIHIHCTDRPRHADWRGLASMEAMRRHHMRIGMSDIAQHLTVDPQGGIWTGRAFDVPPASVRGHNGTAEVGPFMIEMVGFFQDGVDVLADPQAASVHAVVVAVLRKFGLDASAVKFHREFGSVKTCPGLDLDADAFRKVIADMLALDAKLPAAARASRAVQRRLHLAASPEAIADARASADVGDAAEGDARDFEVPEDAASLAAQQALAEVLDSAGVAAPGADGARAMRALGLTRDVNPRFQDLVGHVINTSKGVLSGAGLMHQTVDDLDILIREHLAPAFAGGGMKHVVFYAHGGLVSEESALCYARTMLPWWLARGVYPIFFVWESSLFGTLWPKPRARARGISDWTDKGLEIVLQLAARPIWATMKKHARENSAPTTQFDMPGGLFQFAQRFNAWFDALPSRDRPKLHAVGHSTGPILLARFMPLVWSKGKDIARPFTSLSHLAPAMRIDDFLEEVSKPMADLGAVDALDIYTMNERAEKDDDVADVYRKSLLYFVRNACEDKTDGRILGLQEDLIATEAAARYFGLDATSKYALTVSNAASRTRIEFSQHQDQSPQNQATMAIEHGAFDNDAATMGSVLGRILGLAPGTPLPPGPIRFPASSEFKRCERERDRARGYADDDGDDDIGSAAGAADMDGSWPLAANGGPCPCCPWAGTRPQSAFDAPAGTIDDDADHGAPEDDADAPSTRPQAPLIGGARAGRRLAVCIGIDAYRDSPLAGCVNDSKAWRRRLEALGFKVTPLINRNATRAALDDALAELVARARPGDELVFQFAGHGSQVADVDGDETDRYDEVLCPVDYHRGELFIDDDIYVSAAKLGLAPGAHLTFLMDCCHSGTNTRAAPPRVRPRAGQDRRGRWMTLPADAVEKYLALRQRGTRAARAFGTRSERDPLPGVVSFAACRDREVALEHDGQGDFTRHALAVLDGVVERGASNAAFLSAVLRRFGDDREQTPQMQDPLPALRKRAFLGGRP
jgi:hypothetical protein